MRSTTTPVRRPLHRLPAAAVAALSVGALCVAGMSSASAAPADDIKDQIFGKKTVVAQGLDNPRQLSLVGNGQLYIAEAGSGGDTCLGEGEQVVCFGDSGAISQVLVPQFAENATPKRVVTGLFSNAGPDGSFATGADGVSAASASEIYIAISAGDPEGPQVPGAAQAGKLLRGGFLRPVTTVADIAAYETANDPDAQGVESNPYATLVIGGGTTLVADAAGNTVLAVDKRGNVSTFAVLPNITTGECEDRPNEGGTVGCDFVPTSLALGPDGGIYVGGLGSEVPGAGSVIKYSRSGQVLDTWTGFSNVTGVAVGKDGAVYVSQLFGPEFFDGSVVKVAPGGDRSSIDVPFPAGLAVDAQNNIYVAAYSVSTAEGSFGPGTSGQVWRIRF
jgi:hypothetical protein